MRSIAHRIQFIVVMTTLVAIGVLSVSVLYTYEELERTILHLDTEAGKDFLQGRPVGDGDQRWDTEHLTAFFQSSNSNTHIQPQEIFRGLVAPYSAELELGSKTFLVTVDDVPGGTIYIAKDITAFENREHAVRMGLLYISMAVLLLGTLITHFAARRVVGPLKRLTQSISQMHPSARLDRVDENQADTELASIASTFNSFLAEMEGYVQRQRLLLTMASHELRTPVAVMRGALDVIEQRNSMSVADRVTLERIRRATEEMHSNIQAILLLTRGDKSAAGDNLVREIRPLVEEIVVELEGANFDTTRITIRGESILTKAVPASLVKILLRNLIQNSLQHTQGAVIVAMYSGSIMVIDAAQPVDISSLSTASGQNRTAARGPGLGLFIVTLICERIGWRLLPLPVHQELGMEQAGVEVVFVPSPNGRMEEPS